MGASIGWSRQGRRLRLGVGIASVTLWVGLSGLAGPAALAQTAPTPAAPAADPAVIEAKLAALRRAQAAVVRVKTTAVPDALTNETLGPRRLGSGVVIDRDGLVLTIGYLILEAETVDLEFEGNRSVPARVVGFDVATGFGLVRPIIPLQIQPVPLGRSTELNSRQPLVSISGGSDGAIALARVVSQRPFSGSWEYHIDQALYTAPARDDHSGAALFTDSGELVGVGSLVMADVNPPDDPAVQPGNLFVPIDLLKPILAELRSQGISKLSKRAWLGLNSAEGQGQIRVIRVNRDSPAFDAGLRAGDRIEAIDDEKVSTLEQFYKALWKGDTAEREVKVVVRRAGQTQVFTVQSIDRSSTFKRSRGI
jgi:serine protease Do